MATAQSIITRALRKLGQVSAGEDPTADELSDGLNDLNDMVSSWDTERLMCFAIRDETFPTVAAQPSYTLGPGADLDTVRPVQIISAYVVVGTTSYPVHMLNEVEYAAIPDKSTAANFPERAYYQPDMPAGTLYTHPVPGIVVAMHVLTRTPVDTYVLSDTVSLPPGWVRALVYNLAIEIAPDYEKEPPAAVIKIAGESKANIKRVNSRPLKAYTELPALVGRRRRGNIIDDRP